MACQLTNTTISDKPWPDDATVPFRSNPFPLEISTKMDLFKGPLFQKDNDEMATRYNGTYMHWIGALLHITDKTRWDIEYLVMCLSVYNNCRSIPCYSILYQDMCYLFHHPHVPIIYPATKLVQPRQLHYFGGKCDVEIKKDIPKSIAWTDTDLDRDVLYMRSTTRSVHKWNGIALEARYVKHPGIATSTNDAEVRSMLYATRRIILYRIIN